MNEWMIAQVLKTCSEYSSVNDYVDFIPNRYAYIIDHKCILWNFYYHLAYGIHVLADQNKADIHWPL